MGKDQCKAERIVNNTVPLIATCDVKHDPDDYDLQP